MNTTGQGPLKGVKITGCCAPAKAFHLIPAAERVSIAQWNEASLF